MCPLVTASKELIRLPLSDSLCLARRWSGGFCATIRGGRDVALALWNSANEDTATSPISGDNGWSDFDESVPVRG